MRLFDRFTREPIDMSRSPATLRSETGEFAVGPEPRDSAIIDLRDTQRSDAPNLSIVGNAESGALGGPDASVQVHRRADDQFGVAVDELLPGGGSGRVDGEQTASAMPSTRSGEPRQKFSTQLLRACIPFGVVLAVTMVLISVIWQKQGDLQVDRELAQTYRVSLDSHRLHHDGLWQATLGVVASGVGAQVASSDDVNRLLGQQPHALTELQLDEVSSSFGSEATQKYDAAASSYAEFASSVDDIFSEGAVSPVELSNQLGELAASSSQVRDAVQVAVAAADDIEANIGADQARARQGLVLVGVVALIGVAGSVWWLRRFLARRVAAPLAGLAHAALAEQSEGSVVTASRDAMVDTSLDIVAEVDHAIKQLHSRQSMQQQELYLQESWRRQDQQIVEALEIAESELEVYQVVGRSLTASLDTIRGEFIMSDRNSTILNRVAHNLNVPAPHCPVDQVAGCVALRRGEAVIFDDSESVHSCPKMRGRPEGRCAAVCVPVTISARQVGVIHMSTSVESPVPLDQVQRIRSLAGRVGARLETLRAIEHSMKEAATDGLTGLPNRRQLEAEVAALVESETPFVMVIADLDKFKRLNDTYGHEVGDKALQLFARVLAENVRGNDVVARLGGEEFVLVYPNMSVDISIEAINRIRAALARALENSSVPPFTCSFGVTHSGTAESGEAILRVADAGLLRAKELGGDQAVFADDELSATVFGQPDSHHG